MKRVYAREEVCMACTLCEVHCLVQHSRSRDLVKAFKRERPRPMKRLRVEERGALSFAFQCRHCPEPDCVYACVTGALAKGEDGVVLVQEDKCIGCWTCIMACPYGSIERDLAQGVASKCDLCPGEEIPACVKNCPNEALVFAEEGELAWLSTTT